MGEMHCSNGVCEMSSCKSSQMETLDAYIKRLEKLEEIAQSYDGVERTYAIQAGREVRVMVAPEKIDESSTVVLAHDIAQSIESITRLVLTWVPSHLTLP